MSERDRRDPYDRNQQNAGGGNYGQSGSSHRNNDSYDSPRQANQWQSDGGHQAGGDWQHDNHLDRGSQSRDYRFSGQDQNDDDYGRGSYGSGSSGQRNEDWLRSDQRQAARNYEQGRERQRPYARNQQRDDQLGYGGRSYDASGGNDFGSFTSEDYGGRDFYNRSGGISGGARSSESYRPSYGLSSWTGGRSRDQDSDRDYSSWREFGEHRGFLARAGDEVASWFGSEDATRRREQDRREDHSGRGPSGYTRSDDRIREDANDHLTHDANVDATHINVSVSDGEVTLNGTVASREAKRRAEDVVDRISGVKHVQNNLRVQDRQSASNQYSSGGSSGSQASTSQYRPSEGSGSSSGVSSGSGSYSSNASGGSGQTTGHTTGQTSGETGASTTSGIGSTATAGVSGASTTRANEKTS